ncbi:MAG: hypothetical protein HY917_04045 [Candidatus Diapherotrites archaeon]|nr:hypothetical protein [Candidatus Diapherotrites archaeon]
MPKRPPFLRLLKETPMRLTFSNTANSVNAKENQSRHFRPEKNSPCSDMHN